MPIPLIDTHVHLFDESNLHTLRWMTSDSPLHGRNDIHQYLEENVAKLDDRFEFRGLIYIDSDVKTELDAGPEGLKPGVDEFCYVLSQATEKPASIVAIVPWAPVALGREKLSSYFNLLRSQPGPVHLLKGCRFLLQDKPHGTMLTPEFVDGVNWLGENNLVFDVGIDFRRRGARQFDEFSQLLGRCKGVTFTINHFAKPDLSDDKYVELFEAWSVAFDKILDSPGAAQNRVYMKLSGLFSEIGVQRTDADIVTRALPYFEYVLRRFAQDRIIWGSDWPVSTLISGRGSLCRWLSISEECFRRIGVSEGQKEMIYWENAKAAFSIAI